MDSKSKSNIGMVKVPLKSLLSEQDMIVDQFYNLHNSGPTSQIRMRLCLRVSCCWINWKTRAVVVVIV